MFSKAASLLAKGENVALVTVISTTGSTPGKVGYKMLVFAEGRETLGTVGGGRVEAEMIEQAGRTLAETGTRVFQFDLSETSDDEMGVCGGSVELLVETFNGDALPLFRDLAATTQAGEPAVLVSIITPEGTPRKTLLSGVEAGAAADRGLAPEILRAVEEVAAAGYGATRVSAGSDEGFVECLGHAPVAVIFGAGHLSYHIARFARSVHFRTIIYDDRGEYANRERFPDADTVIVADLGRIKDSVTIDKHSYVVIVTRGHNWDEIVLEQVLQTDARYVGMIGSKRKTVVIRDKLRDKGVGTELLDNVYAPIGLSVGAVTCEEIALSIVCELVKVRRIGRQPHIDHMTLFRPGAQA